MCRITIAHKICHHILTSSLFKPLSIEPWKKKEWMNSQISGQTEEISMMVCKNSIGLKLVLFVDLLVSL
jgi:hypothetical protein